MATHFRTAPARENARVVNIALESAFSFRRIAQKKHFSQIAAGAVQAIGGLGKSGDLAGAALEQVNINPILLDGKDAASVPGTGNQMSGRGKSERINYVFL